MLHCPEMPHAPTAIPRSGVLPAMLRNALCFRCAPTCSIVHCCNSTCSVLPPCSEMLRKIKSNALCCGPNCSVVQGCKTVPKEFQNQRKDQLYGVMRVSGKAQERHPRTQRPASIHGNCVSNDTTWQAKKLHLLKEIERLLPLSIQVARRHGRPIAGNLRL